jgi:hypothetical protein
VSVDDKFRIYRIMKKVPIQNCRSRNKGQIITAIAAVAVVVAAATIVVAAVVVAAIAAAAIEISKCAPWFEYSRFPGWAMN